MKPIRFNRQLGPVGRPGTLVPVCGATKSTDRGGFYRCIMDPAHGGDDHISKDGFRWPKKR